MIIIYNGSQIDSKYFRAYVYREDGTKKLANTWGEHQELIDSGEWFTSKPEPILLVKRSSRKRK